LNMNIEYWILNIESLTVFYDNIIIIVVGVLYTILP